MTLACPALLSAQSPPRDSAARGSTPAKASVPDSSTALLPLDLLLNMGSRWDRLQNLRCATSDAFSLSTNAACHAGFVSSLSTPTFAFKSAGVFEQLHLHVNVDFDSRREFDASQTLSLYYEGDSTARFRRVDVGNISFAPPASRYITSSLPSGNYGVQFTNQLGRVQLKSIFARQAGNIVQARRYDLVERNVQRRNSHETLDYQIERLRFFFTLDPALLRGYPNVDILNRSQLQRIAAALPDTLRPTRVLLYRLQFGGQPQNPNGPRFHVRGSDAQGTQTYDVLREGVDYYMDPSLLWFALVRPLNESNERLVVAYNVRINGRDTAWASTGGTPDIQRDSTHAQIANLVMDPTVGPSSPAFRNEIRSVYRIGGEDVVRSTVRVRVVAGSGLLEHPLAGSDATFLAMFGLAQPTAPSEFDYENRLFPRPGDPAFNLGIGAPDVRNGQSLSIAQIIRDHYLVFPSLRPLAARNAGLVVPGNPTNEPIYTIPGDYLNSVQHPASVYRLNVEYQSTGTDDGGALSLDASQVRQGSEQLVMDGHTLVRDLDYRVDYDLGRIEFTRPDTVYRRPRHLEVKFEENPTALASAATTLGGFVAELPMSHGTLNVTAINQSQSNAGAGFTRPPLGFQGNSNLTTGVSGEFHWDMPRLTSFVNHLPFGASNIPSRISLQGEVAMSRPQFLGAGDQRAFLETFDAGGDIGVTPFDIEWWNSSLPAYGNTLRQHFPGSIFEMSNAATLVWQTNVVDRGGQKITFTQHDIDPLAVFAGAGALPNEPVLWLTLLPLDQVGRFNRSTHAYDWTDPSALTASRRFRSIRTLLSRSSPSGVDLTRGEHLEFWTLIDTSHAGRTRNGSLIFDFGDVSENSIAFAPLTLNVRHTGSTVDSLFTGKRPIHFDTLDTERDPFSHTFNADVNDTGLPGDLIDTLRVIDDVTGAHRASNVRMCRAAPGSYQILGDPITDCTIGNNHLDEEDLDFDNALNFPNALRERERILRYIVDLSDSTNYKRIGGQYKDTVFIGNVPQPRTRSWVLVSMPIQSPTDSLNDVNRRRIRALRLTLVSGAGQSPEEATQIPIADLRITSAPWLNRSTQTLVGVSGIQLGGGYVITSSIGTNDSTSALVYQPPPGIINQADTRAAQFAGTVTQINEQSMRIQAAGNMPLYHRAEAYLRFPAGSQSYLNYRQLRVWGRGRGNGWGLNGDLQMYVKLGRDENNFYMYRAPVSAGQTQAAWSDLVVDLNRFVDLRRQIQNAYASGKKESIACTGVDSAIIAVSPIPPEIVTHRFAACADGYMVYTLDPAVTAPNLGAVQELAVGMLRVAAGATTLVPSDTLELWVDDIRLDRQVNTTGRAGQIALTANIGDFMDLRLNIGGRDPNFRQMGEQPTFLGQRTTDMSATVRLEKLLPPGLGFSLPMTITKLSLGTDPLYLSQTDISARGIGTVRAPKNDITTYSLSIRRSTPLKSSVFGPLVNNLGVTTSYVSGVDRTEFQDGNASNFSVAVDYLVTPDSARTADLPEWASGALGALPQVLQAGPIGVLRTTHFRWNPTQLRVTSTMTRGDDRRTSFLNPTTSALDAPATARASSRLWRNGSTLELRPTNGLSARWALESVRDFRDYRDSTIDFGVGFGPQALRVAPGFERERSILTNFTFAPSFSAWLRPRADFGTQYGMLRDPNVRGFAPLPGVIGVDSVLAARDTADFFRLLRVPRRMTAAQTSSIGTTIDVARAFIAYAHDSTGMARRFGGLFAPIDVSYTRSLLAALDASDEAAPLMLQLGLRGPAAYRVINGVDATTTGQTGILSATGTLLLPFGTSLANRYRRAATLNWIQRPDSSVAHVDGTDTRFPDATVQWAYRPATPTSAIASFDANVGYARSQATVSLPNLLFSDTPPQIRHTHADVLPIGANVAWTGTAATSLGARFSFLTQLDSLPGSVAHQHGNEVNVDGGRAFHVPASLGLGLKSDLRTRFNFNQRRTTTTVVDTTGSVQARLQDNGRQSFSLTADAGVLDNATFTMQGQYVLVYDKNLNHRTAQTLFAVMLQFHVFGSGKQ